MIEDIAKLDWTVVGGGLLLLWLTYQLVSHIINYARLRHIPGPFSLRLSPWWVIRQQWTGKHVYEFRNMNEKYGSLTVIGPKLLSCSDYEEFRKLLIPRTKWTRSPWFQAARLHPLKDNILNEQDRAKHNAMRLRVLPGYTAKLMEDVEGKMQERVDDLIELLETKYVSSDDMSVYRPFDMAAKASYLTLDVISSLAFSETFGHLQADSDKYDYLKSTEMTAVPVFTLSWFPSIIKLMQHPLVVRLIGVQRLSMGGKMVDMTRDIVAERYGENAKVKNDMLGAFVQNHMSQSDSEGEVMLQVLAGSDTTACVVKSIVMLLGTNPKAYTRFLSEIDQRIADGQISTPITSAEGKEFPYLQAIIREALRLYAPGASMQPRICYQDTEVCGYKVPAGTTVAISAFSVFRDKQVFGPDADMFRPERWLEASPEKAKIMEKVTMMAFNTGGWAECLGKPIALMELNKVMVELYRRYDIRVVDPENVWNWSVALVIIQTDLNVVLTKRRPAVK